MNVDQFDYELPEELIAQHPVQPRDASRLLRFDRASKQITHHQFHELTDLLQPNDLLIFNNTRVLHARLLGHRESTGGKWEGLFVQSHPEGAWEMMSQSRGRLHPGEIILVEHPQDPNQRLRLQLQQQHEGRWLALPESEQSTFDLLAQFGHVPLPPYIRKGRAESEDTERYQTVYAQQEGAIAAPTAGLHFTDELMQRLEEKGIQRSFVTLHVGIGTFQPVKVQNVTEHQMHQEWGELTQPTIDAITQCRDNGGRVIAVGTTTVRVLETVAAQGPLVPWSGLTDLFIYPPYELRVIQGLITNFHLPRSTLLMLVAALVGVETVHEIYREALAERYRFYSYGDATLLL